MKRRTFLASLFALPFAIKAVCSNPNPFVEPPHFKLPKVRSSCGCSLTRASIQSLTPQEMINLACAEGKLDLDEIFKKIYEIKQARLDQTDIVLFRFPPQ